MEQINLRQDIISSRYQFFVHFYTYKDSLAQLCVRSSLSWAFRWWGVIVQPLTLPNQQFLND